MAARSMRAIFWTFAAGIGAPASAAGLTSGSAPDISWLRIALALVFCLALAAAAALALRKRGSAGTLRFLTHFRAGARALPRPRIRIIETRRASQHGDLCLVEAEGHTYFLALTAGGASLLDKQREAAADADAGDGA